MISSVNLVPIVEKNGQAPAAPEALRVMTHTRQPKWILLKIGDQSVAVQPADLLAAVRNAQNSGPYARRS